MTRLTVKTAIDPNTMQFGPPDGTTPVDGATNRVKHQFFKVDDSDPTQFNDKFGIPP
jgi:hypothetical protein